VQSRLIVGLVCGLVVGLGLALCLWPQGERACGQQFGAGAAYEYSVVRFTGMNEAAHTKQMNQMAAAGWEYAGLVSLQPAEPTFGYVAFRRPLRR